MKTRATAGRGVAYLRRVAPSALLLAGACLYGCSERTEDRAGDSGADTSSQVAPAVSRDASVDGTIDGADAEDEDVTVSTDLTDADASDADVADVTDADASNDANLDADAPDKDVVVEDVVAQDVIDSDVVDTDVIDQDVVDEDAGVAVAPDASTISVLTAVSDSCAQCAASGGCDVQGENGDTCDVYSGADQINCIDVLTCELRTGCQDIATGLLNPCFCGAQDPSACRAGTVVPDGGCVQELEAAFGDASPGMILDYLVMQTVGGPPFYPGGSAGAIVSCLNGNICPCSPP